MLRSIGLFIVATTVALVSCSRMSDDEIKEKLSIGYGLRWPYPDNILTRGNARSAKLTIHKDGTFLQQCVDEHGVESSVAGQWTQKDDWINFSAFYDCVGAWPDTKTIISTGLHFSLGSSPVIVVEPDLNVIYVAK